MNSVINRVLCLLVMVLLTACSTSYVRVDETHKSGTDTIVPHKKLLVIGVTSPRSFRQSFENIFVDSLQRHGVTAVASYKYIDNLRDATKEEVRQLAKQVGADAVVITRTVSKSEHTSYSLATGHAEYRVVSKTTTTANSSTTISMSGAGYVAGEIDQAGAFVVTHFFDAESAELIWSAKSHAAGVSSDKMDVCWKLSFALAEALGEDGLIRVTVEEPKMPSL